jgi:hypothetical protein
MIENTNIQDLATSVDVIPTNEFVAGVLESLSAIDLSSIDPAVADVVTQIYELCEVLSLLAF